MLISQFMKDKSQRAEDLLWACDDKTLEGQVEWYKKLCAKGKESYEQLLARPTASIFTSLGTVALGFIGAAIGMKIAAELQKAGKLKPDGEDGNA